MRRLAFRLGQTRAPLEIACLFAIVYGWVLRATSLGYPPKIKFDEYHFVDNARRLLAGTPDLNDHPPFGKMILGWFIRWFGDRPWSWRIPALLSGCALVIGFGLLAGRLFRDRRVGWIAAALVAMDGFFIAYSRLAVLDGMLTLCFVLAAYLLAGRQREAELWGAASATGIACSLKLSGVVLGVPLLVAALRQAPRYRRLLALGAVPVVFYALCAWGQIMGGESGSVTAVLTRVGTQVTRHAAASSMENSAASHWSTWLVSLHPIVIFCEEHGQVALRVSTTMGNPLVYAGTTACVLGLVGAGGFLALTRRVSGRPRWLRARDWRAARFLFVFWLLPILPWMLTRRDSYHYHYLPAYGFGVVLFAALIVRLHRARWAVGLGLLLASIVIGGYYAPLANERSITMDAWAKRALLPDWRE